MITSTNSIFDLNSTALVVTDLQGLSVGAPSLVPYSSAQVVGNVCKLADAFESKGAFIVLVKSSTYDGKDMLNPRADMPEEPLNEPDDYAPELKKYKSAYLLTKRQWGAFHGTELDLQLRRRKIETIILCGISTSRSVDTTAREAYQFGYHQVFAEDAMTAFTKEEHEYVCKYIFPPIGKILKTNEILEFISQENN